MTSRSTRRRRREPSPDDGLRFEATVHPGDKDVPMARVADLDLDRVPDPGRRPAAGQRGGHRADCWPGLRGAAAPVVPVSRWTRTSWSPTPRRCVARDQVEGIRGRRRVMYRTVAQLDRLGRLLADAGSPATSPASRCPSLGSGPAGATRCACAPAAASDAARRAGRRRHARARADEP